MAQTDALVKRMNKGKNEKNNVDKNLGDKVYFEQLAKAFSNQLGGLKVSINPSAKKMEIRYNSNDDLELVMHKIGVKLV